MCVCVCVRACVRVCVRARACVRVRDLSNDSTVVIVFSSKCGPFTVAVHEDWCKFIILLFNISFFVFFVVAVVFCCYCCFVCARVRVHVCVCARACVLLSSSLVLLVVMLFFLYFFY